MTMNTWTPTIIRFKSLPSTNTEAAQRAVRGVSEGLCIVADKQTAGRGRLQREWISPSGAGLYCSILLRPRIDQRDWSLITLMASIAVHDTLLECCGLETDIKWPNDILVRERKLCGILAEAIDTPIGRAAVLGIGINLTADSFPPFLFETATSVQSAGGTPSDKDALLNTLLQKVHSRYELLQSPAGRELTVADWSNLSSYANRKRVRIANGDDVLEGTTRGLETDGALRVETDAGEIRIIRAGDVTMIRSVHL